MTSTMSDLFPPLNNGLGLDLCLLNYKLVHDTIIRPWMYGNIFSGIVYGSIVILYFAYIQLMRRQYRNVDQPSRQAWILLGYATLTFILCTLTIASAVVKSVELLNYPLCSLDELLVYGQIEGGAGVVGNICFMLTSWTSDALLIWRCLIIYHDLGRRKWLVVAIPLVLQVGSIGTGGIFCYVLSATRRDLFGFMVYYESIALTLNVILTALIISRLLFLRRRTQRALGPDYGYEYTNLAAMLTESQILTMIAQSVMLAFVCYSNPVINNGESLTMYQILGQVQALAPMLIIYRVIQGKAWSSNTFAQITKSRSFGTV
ncbi:hypothetical protein BDQ17DRAFT_1367779 [Cyathus striatus]|nr:hypothetical protein BDQ17DRAFT_1367779 [Cyathus striatus]